ncbi:hypothetical protein [Nocardioides limicola]|uniref:hypothetical protein n=1 Tax=Nocardioides limicola TaxID=2803368 RepID=UPI00193BA356|nr:hypothetical protein [Nocardioides sp. DJM-14]
MMKRAGAVLSAAVLGFAVTACGGTDDPVAWADKVCSALEDPIEALMAEPEIDPSDLEATQAGLVDYLDNAATSIGDIKDAFGDAGAPPVEGGDDLADEISTALSSAQTAIGEARDKVAEADASDPMAFSAALSGMSGELASLTSAMEAVGSLDSNPELQSAAEQAKSCQFLNDM